MPTDLQAPAARTGNDPPKKKKKNPKQGDQANEPAPQSTEKEVSSHAIDVEEVDEENNDPAYLKEQFKKLKSRLRNIARRIKDRSGDEPPTDPNAPDGDAAQELTKEVSNMVLEATSPATQMAQFGEKLNTIVQKVDHNIDTTKDLKETLHATREEFLAKIEAQDKKISDLSERITTSDDKAALDSVGKDGASFLLKHKDLDFDEDYVMKRTVERVVKNALDKHSKIIGDEEARELVLKWVDRIGNEKPVSEGEGSPHKAISGNMHAAREEDSGHGKHGHHADYRKVPQPPKFAGSLNADVTCARTWFDSVMRYCDRVHIDPLEDFWGFLQGKAAVWGNSTLERHLNGTAPLTRTTLREKFLLLYGEPDCNDAARVREKLRHNEHAMRAGETVAQYTQRYYDIIREAPDMAPYDQISNYINGLREVLRAQLSRDPNTGRNWETLDAIVDHARAKDASYRERRLEMRKGHTSHTPRTPKAELHAFQARPSNKRPPPHAHNPQAKRPRREGSLQTACGITIDRSNTREHNSGCPTCKAHVRALNDKKRAEKPQPRNGD